MSEENRTPAIARFRVKYSRSQCTHKTFYKETVTFKDMGEKKTRIVEKWGERKKKKIDR